MKKYFIARIRGTGCALASCLVAFVDSVGFERNKNWVVKVPKDFGFRGHQKFLIEIRDRLEKVEANDFFFLPIF